MRSVMELQKIFMDGILLWVSEWNADDADQADGNGFSS